MKIAFLLCPVALMASLVAPSAPASASATPARSCSAGRHSKILNFENVNNDAGHEADPVVGVPKAGPGAVDVHLDPFQHGVAKRYRQAWFAGLPAGRAGDEFGATVEYQFQTHPCTGVAIGAPGTSGGRGAVVLAHGGARGLDRNGAVRLLGRTPGERFGATVTWSSGNGAGDYLTVGAPNRTVHGKAHAGAVYFYRQTKAGRWEFRRMITQDTPGVPGVAGAGDHFGAAFADGGLTFGGVIGAPDDTVAGVPGAGSVTIIDTDPRTYRLTYAKRLTQGGAFPGRPQRGDHFGASVYADTGTDSTIAVGVPGDRVHGQRAAGRVEYFDDFTNRAGFDFTRSVSQDTPGVQGIAEAGDRFGASIANTGFDDLDCSLVKQPVGSRPEPVMIGSPGEDVGTIRNAGAITILTVTGPTAHDPVCGPQWTQHPDQHPDGSTVLNGRSQAGDRLGQSLTFLRPAQTYDCDCDGPPPTRIGEPTFIIGVPGEDTGHGRRDAGRIILFQPFRHAGPRSISRTAVGGGQPGNSYGAVLPGSRLP